MQITRGKEYTVEREASDAMKFNNLKDQKWFPYTVAACVAVLFWFILQHLGTLGSFISIIFTVCIPIIIGIVLAYIMDPVVRLFEKKPFGKVKKAHTRRMLAILLTILIVLACIVVLIVMLIPQLVESITGIVSNLDKYKTAIMEYAKNVKIDVATVEKALTVVTDKLKEMLPQVAQYLVANSTDIGSAVMNIIIGFIFAVYFLFEKNITMGWLRRFFQKVLKKGKYVSFSKFCARCHEILTKYVTYSLIEALFVGATNALLMSIFRLPDVILISVVVGVTNLAPTFGPIIGGLIGSIILVLQNPFYALYFLIFTVAIQMVDGYVVKPKLYGNTLGVSSLWILIAIVVFGRLFGVIGMLIAIPFAAIVQILLRDFLTPMRVNMKREKPSTAEREEVSPDANPESEETSPDVETKGETGKR